MFEREPELKNDRWFTLYPQWIRDQVAQQPINSFAGGGGDPSAGSGKMVMPGFANTHTHLTMTLARGVFEDLSPPHKPPFSGGLSPIPLPNMTPEERRVMVKLGALQRS